MEQKYSHTKKDKTKETWEEISKRVAKNVLRALPDVDYELIKETETLIRERKFLPGGRYLYAAGRPYHQVQNCLLLRADDSREGWAELANKATMALMTGAGIGIDYSAIRPEGSVIRKTGGTATGPNALMQMLNEIGRGVMQGGSRRSAIWAGLNWKHADIHKFIRLKNWSEDVRALKEKDFNFPAPMDGTNISVILDKTFFDAYHNPRSVLNAHAHSVYWAVVEQMVSSAEPGFSVDYDNPRESLRNACTEVTSEDDSDICNLGSINMARIETKAEFRRAVELGVQFLLAGTLYSDVPYAKVDMTRTKNRRLGLGIMGVHEWLLKRGKPYGACDELTEWMQEYMQSTDIALRLSNQYGISAPVKTRAVAPTGTIGILAETSTGIEPLFCVAYKRRYLKGSVWHYQYVIDPTAKRLIDSGVNPDQIEDAYSLADNIERRVAFQAYMQEFVDHGISSTVNLPAWGSELNNTSTMQDFGKMLINYLPKLRGITCYPDGARGGQPLTPVKYNTAIKHTGEIFLEAADICDITKGGSCSS
jgi:ribonucleoside-diphosphate reductase alpha chain